MSGVKTIDMRAHGTQQTKTKAKCTHKTQTHGQQKLNHQPCAEQGPALERRLSEYVNPEMRETLGFPFQNGRFLKPEKAG